MSDCNPMSYTDIADILGNRDIKGSIERYRHSGAPSVMVEDAMAVANRNVAHATSIMSIIDEPIKSFRASDYAEFTVDTCDGDRYIIIAGAVRKVLKVDRYTSGARRGSLKNVKYLINGQCVRGCHKVGDY